MPTFRAVFATQTDNQINVSLQELDRAVLPPGEVLIRVQYSSLNYKDGGALKGRPGFIRKFPMVLGIDLAGVVEESASSEFKAGDEVVVTGFGMAETQWGGYSEYARLDAKYVLPLPEGLSTRRAMAIGTAGFTAMQCVMALESHRVGKERPILVTGAGGGVGSVAIAILSHLGYRVTASTGRAELHNYLYSLGANELVDRAEVIPAAKGPLASERWAGVVDSVGGETLAGALKSIEMNGSVAACGIAGGGPFTTHVAPFILRGVNLLGINSVYVAKTERVEIWRRLSTDLPSDRLDAMTQEQPLEAVFELADEILAGRVRGRTVIAI